MNRPLSRLLIGLSVSLSFLLGLAAAVHSSQVSSDLRWIAASSPHVSWQRTHERLRELAERLGGRRAARIGLELIGTLASEGPSTPERLANVDKLEPYPVEALLRRALVEQRYHGCIKTVRWLRASGVLGYEEYEAAALLELGEVEAARRTWQACDRRIGLIGRRLHEVLAQSRDLELTQVRDVTGRLLGTYGQGDFVPAVDVPSDLLGGPVLAVLASLPPRNGVRLTLDLEIGRLAKEALAGHRGSVVVIEPSNGGVLAAVSDERSRASEPVPSFEVFREPASIAKLMTVSAALRAGIDPEEVVAGMNCRGMIRLGGKPLYCNGIHGRLRSLEHAMAISCNVAFAELGRLVGRQGIVAEYERYGYDREAPGLGGLGRVLAPTGDARQLGDLSIGLQAAELPPVHAALQAASYANGGVMFPPRIFHSFDSYLGLAPRHALSDGQGWRVLEPEWLPTLRRSMRQVVRPGGTAFGVESPGFPVAMKTGTASHPGLGYHVNYIGFAPVDAPLYAFAVRITHQRSARGAGQAGRYVTTRLLRRLADYAQSRRRLQAT